MPSLTNFFEFSFGVCCSPVQVTAPEMVNKPEVDCAREEIFVISSVEGGLHLKLTEGVSIITDPLLKRMMFQKV